MESETPLAAPSSANGVAGSGPLRLLLRIVLRLGGPKPEQGRAVAVQGVESGERLAFATGRTNPGGWWRPERCQGFRSHPRCRSASVSGSGP